MQAILQACKVLETSGSKKSHELNNIEKLKNIEKLNNVEW